MTTLPQNYVIQKLYTYAGKTTYKSSTKCWNAMCPICKEGKSWGKKKRLYYFLTENFLLCHNCSRSWSPIQWVKEVTGLTYQEIQNEILEGDFDTVELVLQNSQPSPAIKNSYTLPEDCINLFDPQQLEYYQDNKVIQDAIEFISKRRLDTAINRPNKLWISLKDFVHKNRLIIPFTDPDGKIRFYTSRAIYKKDEEIAKYLSKINSNKTIYGLNKIDSSLDYLFLFEGSIDAMFAQNGLGICGLKLTEQQQSLLQKYSLYKKIFVLDNQLENKEVYAQYKKLLKSGENVFIWPSKYRKIVKDINELCVELKVDKINPEFFIKNCRSI